MFGEGSATPAKPKSFFFTTLATVTALNREIAYASLPPLSYKRARFRAPPLGSILLVSANLVLLLVLCFYRLDPQDRVNLGYRTGYINICQLPLLFLLAGRQNIVGLLTGFGYERLNWLHRWAARCLLLTATVHVGNWFADWAPDHAILAKMKSDPMNAKGLGAWAVLVWIVVSSVTPIRGWNYEFFVVQHLLSFVAFMTMVYLHTSAQVHVWIWISVALFFLDRLIRLCSVLYNSLAIFHSRNGPGNIWACKATFTPLSHDTTRISIRDPPLKWRAGQHVFITCPSIVPLQSHPFTVASLPHDGKLELIVQSKKGGTRRFFHHAQRHFNALPLSSVDVSMASGKSVAIEGPYGRMRPLSQFDSVIFLAGSTGATFTVPLMREIILSWTESRQSRKPFGRFRSATRCIRFVWVVKSQGQLSWFSEQLSTVASDLACWRESGIGPRAGEVQVEMSVYLTCALGFTADESTLSTPVAAVRSKPSYGLDVEYLPAPPSDEKIPRIEVEETSSIPPTLTDRSNARRTCGPDGTCCCTSTVDDEDAISGIACTCDRAPPQPLAPSEALAPSTDKSSPPNASESSPRPLHPSITMLTGRPNLCAIIRKALEQALGEAAVVACGPRGLTDDVRRVVVGLSDERAVHKGTGAQGIYLHTEAFGY